MVIILVVSLGDNCRGSIQVVGLIIVVIILVVSLGDDIVGEGLPCRHALLLVNQQAVPLHLDIIK